MVKSSLAKRLGGGRMNWIISWAEKGGAPAWNRLAIGDALEALGLIKAECIEVLARARSPKVTFRWSTYLEIDTAWAKFEAVYRLCHAGQMMELTGFEQAARVAEASYDDIHLAGRQSRGLALGVARLKGRGRLAKWQVAALDRSALGEWGFRSRIDRQRASVRQATLESLEERCLENVASSLEMSPIWITDRRQLRGIPPWLIALGKQRAKAKGCVGWIFHATSSEYASFMGFASDREARRLMYRAKCKAGSEHVPGCDNAMLGKKILSIRRRQAKDARHASCAHYALSGNMLVDPEDVEAMLLAVARDATPAAVAERASAEAWMKERGAIQRLEPWDYRFAREGLASRDQGDLASKAMAYFAPAGAIERCVEVAAKFFGMSSLRARADEGKDLMAFKISSPQGFCGHVTIAPRRKSKSGASRTTISSSPVRLFS
jgi:hypothetical protein